LAGIGRLPQETDEKIAARAAVFPTSSSIAGAGIIRALKSRCEHDILHRCRSSRQGRHARASTASPRLWQVSVWRTALAAAFGAIAAVILLAAHQSRGRSPARRRSDCSSCGLCRRAGRRDGSRWCGAAARRACWTHGLTGLPLRIARKLGAVFALLRAGPPSYALGVLLVAVHGDRWLLGGSQPLHVLMG